MVKCERIGIGDSTDLGIFHFQTMTMDNTAGNSTGPQPASASNTDPEFWMKRLNDIKKGADIQTGPQNPEMERPVTNSTPGNTYLLKQTEDSNRATSQVGPSFKDQVRLFVNQDIKKGLGNDLDFP